MPSKQSEAIRRRWEASWLAMTQPDGEGPDDESWGDLTSEPREVDYLESSTQRNLIIAYKLGATGKLPDTVGS
jgi:hypothetical protein